MTRTEFIEAYAARSHLSAKWATLGFIDIAGHVKVALPCACGEPECEGWAMLSAEAVLDHLERHAPEALRKAYINAVNARPSSRAHGQ